MRRSEALAKKSMSQGRVPVGGESQPQSWKGHEMSLSELWNRLTNRNRSKTPSLDEIRELPPAVVDGSEVPTNGVDRDQNQTDPPAR
jgi:hypothetical protein